MSKCKLSKHTWSEWKITNRGDMKIGDITRGKYIYQERKCHICDYTELDFQSKP